MPLTSDEFWSDGFDRTVLRDWIQPVHILLCDGKRKRVTRRFRDCEPWTAEDIPLPVDALFALFDHAIPLGQDMCLEGCCNLKGKPSEWTEKLLKKEWDRRDESPKWKLWNMAMKGL